MCIFIILKSNALCSRMTYQENKENKEHIGDEIDWPKNPVSTVDGIIFKVSENNPELCKTIEIRRDGLINAQSYYSGNSC